MLVSGGRSGAGPSGCCQVAIAGFGVEFRKRPERRFTWGGFQRGLPHLRRAGELRGNERVDSFKRGAECVLRVRHETGGEESMYYECTNERNVSGSLRLRIESCVTTVLQLHERLGHGMIEDDIIEHFEQLKDSLDFVTADSVDENDIRRLEIATNDLLEQMRAIFDADLMVPLHDGLIH